ncbi:hypothetical protein GUJ93_ZPchr0007g3121 [Zizania palustris]|uniref:Exostosin GT47 domain-containing protein n=1 Tax=Zizania palustris TaxID=103762 RepID=A0A8J5SRQ1_ZIZPA|nr:hypothetical protein GUJ93_ZPchr0007g3121 [Zizania palustris]
MARGESSAKPEGGGGDIAGESFLQWLAEAASGDLWPPQGAVGIPPAQSRGRKHAGPPPLLQLRGAVAVATMAPGSLAPCDSWRFSIRDRRFRRPPRRVAVSFVVYTGGWREQVDDGEGETSLRRVVRSVTPLDASRMMDLPQVRPATTALVPADGALVLLLVFAVPATFLYLISAPAASPSLVVNIFSSLCPSSCRYLPAVITRFPCITQMLSEGKIRAKLAKVLKGKDGVLFEDIFATGEGIKTLQMVYSSQSTESMQSSKFCLHPAGDTPSSCRLFDAIVSHCVPVIISSRIELPLEDEIDYGEFSVFFSIEEALRPDHLLNQLRQIHKTKWAEMWSKLKKCFSSL